MAFATSAVENVPLPPIPIQISSIPIHIAVFSPEIPALMPRRGVISAIQVAPKLPPVMRDSGLVMPNTLPVAPGIIGEHLSRA